MNAAPQRLTVEAFLEDAAPRIEAAVTEARAGALRVAAYLADPLVGEPDIRAQLQKFEKALAHAGAPDRIAAVREARDIMADVKKRWIEADAPPLLDEIDDRLGEISKHLDAIAQPDPDAIAEAARKMDTVANQTRQLEGLEQRLTPFAAVGTVLFVVGLFLFFRPVIFYETQPNPSSLTVLFCLGALPALGAYYAMKIKPRSRTDAEIDALNREFFLPNGGIYFPNGPDGACVITVEWTPPAQELSLAEAPRDPRKDKDERAKNWW